jgi:hypothetical protein
MALAATGWPAPMKARWRHAGQADRRDDDQRHRLMRRRHHDEADEEVRVQRAAEDEAHVQGNADGRQDPARDDEAVDGPQRQAIEGILDVGGPVQGEQEDRHEADDEQEDLAGQPVHQGDAGDVGLLGPGVGPVGEANRWTSGHRR